MRRALLTGVLAGSLTVGGAVAAPALSTDPYIPEPVEFELSPAGLDAGQEVGGEVVSRPLDTPKRFDLVGLRWQEGATRPEVELRVRREGEA
jgi:hypothetical protein